MQLMLRIFVICLVALALPVQGIAAATRAHCGPGHQGVATDMAPVRSAAGAGHEHHAVHGKHAGHGAAEAAVHHAHEVASVDPADAGPGHEAHAASTATGDAADADLAKSKCSSCAACCVGSALARAMPRVPEPEAAADVFARLPVAAASHTTGGPDRPPRSLIV